MTSVPTASSGRLHPPPARSRRPPPPGRETTEATAACDQEVFGDLIRRTSDLLASYTDQQLLVIHDFLTRTRQLTPAYADALSNPDDSAAPRRSSPAGD